MLTTILTLLVALSATLNIIAQYRKQLRLVYFFKPLTTILICVLAFGGGAADPTYKTLIIIGLLFSLAGDIFLMLPSDRFVVGLLSFLIAHICYIVAFFNEIDTFFWWPLIPLLLYSVFLYSQLASSLGSFKLPVIVYIGAILIMAWFAWEQWLFMGDQAALSAAIGATFFVLSDSALALNRFRQEFKLADLIILSTYFIAQWLIALSTNI